MGSIETISIFLFLCVFIAALRLKKTRTETVLDVFFILELFIGFVLIYLGNSFSALLPLIFGYPLQIVFIIIAAVIFFKGPKNLRSKVCFVILTPFVTFFVPYSYSAFGIETLPDRISALILYLFVTLSLVFVVPPKRRVKVIVISAVLFVVFMGLKYVLGLVAIVFTNPG